jgi:hypothetical protein
VNKNFDDIVSTKQLVGTIYRIKSRLENNNGYIGLTALEGGGKARLKIHFNNSKLLKKRERSYLYRAMERYGCDSFTVEDIEVIDYSNRVCDLILQSGDDKESLHVGLKDIVAKFSEHLAAREKYYADLFQTYTRSPSPGGYNIAIAGDKPTLGYKHTEEDLEKMRKAHETRPPPSEKTKAKIGAGLRSFYANAGPEQEKKLKDRAERISRAYPVGKSGHKYIKSHRCSGWEVSINNKPNGKFSKTFPTLEEAIVARDEFLSKIQA